LVGRVGKVKSKMLPSGAVQIDGQMIDAVSEGMPLEPGQTVRVLEVRGNMVVVRAVEDDATEAEVEAPGDMLSRPIESLGLEAFDDPLA
jgi:membrane-bound ClpP family serine protease